jgi:hypothetical protein
VKYSSSFFFPATNPLQYCLQQCTLKSETMTVLLCFLRELGTVLAVDCILVKVQPAIGE